MKWEKSKTVFFLLLAVCVSQNKIFTFVLTINIDTTNWKLGEQISLRQTLRLQEKKEVVQKSAAFICIELFQYKIGNREVN